MKNEITLTYHFKNDNLDDKALAKYDKEKLEEAAIYRSRFMSDKGSTSGELHCTIGERSFSGWWEITKKEV